ncbi:MAG: hypothetical protein HQ488_02435 [Parcubacteria group bacterium]|nr:hypothetical protein [Parcubacteria group bacterium]
MTYTLKRVDVGLIFSLCLLALLLVARPSLAMSSHHASVLEQRIERIESFLVNRTSISTAKRAGLTRRLYRLKKKYELFVPQITESVSLEKEPIEYTVIFNGYGQVDTDRSKGSVHLDPMHSTQVGETHAALVVSEQYLHGNYQVSFDLVTESQSRVGSPPNPWEVGWFVFGYNIDRTFKYLLLKPDGFGIELGESLRNDKQNFLWTSRLGDDQFFIGQRYHVSLEVSRNEIIVTIDGVERLRYPLTEKDLLDNDGRFGFYSEDANVTFSNIQMKQF